jgi:hypothetical protein
MTSVPRVTLQFWQRDGFDWCRVPALENVDVTPEWAADDDTGTTGQSTTEDDHD